MIAVLMPRIDFRSNRLISSGGRVGQQITEGMIAVLMPRIDVHRHDRVINSSSRGRQVSQ